MPERIANNSNPSISILIRPTFVKLKLSNVRYSIMCISPLHHSSTSISSVHPLNSLTPGLSLIAYGNTSISSILSNESILAYIRHCFFLLGSNAYEWANPANIGYSPAPAPISISDLEKSNQPYLFSLIWSMILDSQHTPSSL